MNKHIKCSAFTLVELLVVISIIATLLAVLMPALNKARNQAKTVTCGAQCKQIATATMMYVSDNDGSLPFFGACTNTNDKGPYWFELLAKYLSKKSDSNADFYERDSYTADVRRCPAGKNIGDPCLPSGKRWDCWIGTVFSDTSPAAPFYYANKGFGVFKILKVKTPGEAMAYMDVQQHYVYSPADKKYRFDTDSDGDGTKDTNAQLGKKYNNGQPRIHNDGCNAILLDGHVEYTKYKKLWEIDSRRVASHPYWNLNLR